MTGYVKIADEDLDGFSGTLVGVAAFTQKLMQIFKFEHVPLVLDEDWKGALKKVYGIADNVESKIPSPYCYIKITNIGLREGTHNAKTIARSGSGYNISGEESGDLSNSNVEKNYHYWGDIQIELCVGYREFQKFFAFCEKLSIAIKSGGFACFPIVEGNRWSVTVDQSASSIPIQLATKDDASNPHWFTLNHALTIWTQFGVSVEVPKLNNEGVVTTNIRAERQHGRNQ